MSRKCARLVKELVTHPALGELQMAQAVQVRVLVLHATSCWPRLAVCVSSNRQALTIHVLVGKISFLATVLCTQGRSRCSGLSIGSTSVIFFVLQGLYIIWQGGAYQPSHRLVVVLLCGPVAKEGGGLALSEHTCYLLNA